MTLGPEWLRQEANQTNHFFMTCVALQGISVTAFLVNHGSLVVCVLTGKGNVIFKSRIHYYSLGMRRSSDAETTQRYV